VAGVIYKSFPVTEIGESGGDVTVLGKCSDGQLDLDGDIVSPAFMAQAIKAWMRVCPSVYREHSPGHPAGMGIDAWQDDTGATWVKSRISDSESAALCRSGRLKAYSVGLHDVVTRKSARCPRFEIVGGRLTEVSIVPAPANLRCGVKIIGKSASGVPEFIGKAWDMAGKAGKAEKHLRKAAKLLGVEVSALEAGQVVTKLGKVSKSGLLAVSLDSADPWQREQAYREARSRGLHL
jgi:hypothetical protein